MMNSIQESEPNSLEQRLHDPETVKTLNRLLDRAADLERLLAFTSTAEESAPNLAAIATDMADEVCARASRQGIDVEARTQGLLQLFVRLTEPEPLKAAESLIGQLGKASSLLDDLPNLLATAMDVFDEWAARLKADGVDLETSLRQGLNAALWLGCQIRKEELERLGALLRSDVLNEHSIEAVGIAGAALANCHRGACEHPVPKKMGLFGMLAALRDPNTQRAVAFGVQFAKCFGHTLTEKHDPVYHSSSTRGETSS